GRPRPPYTTLFRSDVEEEHGTGRRAYVEGMGICGKTGTAQRRTRQGRDHVTWFASFAPYENPQYVVIVMVEEKNASGGVRCAPIARDIDRKSTRLNSSHVKISYAVFCLKKKNDTIL